MNDEMSCRSPKPFDKSKYNYVLSELLSNNTKFGFSCKSSYNLSPELLNFLNLPPYTQLILSNVTSRVLSYIKTNKISDANGRITCDYKLSKLLNVNECTVFDIRVLLKKHLSQSNLINFNKNDKKYNCYNTKKFIKDTN